MSITIGSKIGPYEVLASVGAGGMGEVYRARDLKLNRDVALKVLPTAFAADAERMSRFQHEARILASLNHPAIAAIYGLEDSGFSPALVLEYVEGPTLADRIARGPIPVDEALAIARQIAEAIEYAHEKNVTHRDLKPANIKICADGSVKVLDFGLAKVFSADVLGAASQSNSPTFTNMSTQAGMIMGTAAYMSPEQAKGKPLDRRTDIWSFGAVLYEMLTGHHAFEGETVTDTLAAIVRGEPDWTKLPAGTPAQVVDLLHRCLQKNAKQRLQSIGDARITLEEAIAAPHSETPALGAAQSAPRRSTSPLAWVACAALSFLAVAAAIGWWTSAHTPARKMQFDVPLAASDSMGFEGVNPIAISPDGSKFALVIRRNGTSQLYVRAIDSVEPVALAGTDGAFGPFFSPGGDWIGFFTGTKLLKIPAIGGSITELNASMNNPRGAVWGRDGYIYLSPVATGGIIKVPESGGDPKQVTTPDVSKNERTHRFPALLPDGKHILFTVGRMDSPEFYDDSEIDVADTTTGERKLVWKGASMALSLPDGNLVVARAGILYLVPFDLAKLAVTGGARPIYSGVAGDTSTGAAFAAFSSSDLLLAAGGTMMSSRSNISFLDSSGKITNLKAPIHFYRDVRLSPDGNTVSSIITERTQDIWLYHIREDKLTRLTYEGLNNAPIWTPDGKTIIYATFPGGGTGTILKSVPSDGSAAPVTIYSPPPNTVATPYSVSPDGKTLFFSENTTVKSLSLTGSDHKATTLIEAASTPVISPDGKYLAWLQSGTIYETFVQPYPFSGARWQISTENGRHPIWSHDGRHMYYITVSGALMTVPVSHTGNSFNVGTPTMLLKNLYRPSGGALHLFDAAPDGRILILNPADTSTSNIKIVFNLNWIKALNSEPASGAK